MKRSWLDKKLSSLLVLAITTLSCSTPTVFKEKYGKEVEKINAARIPQKTLGKEVMYSSPPTQEEWAKMTSQEQNENKYSYVNVDRFDSEKKYLPDKDYYDQMQAYNPSNLIPTDLFKTKYSTILASKFRHTGAEFDTIKTPSYDAYGISALLSQKPYILVGNDVLQSSLDIVDQKRNRIDIMASKIIISEQKDLRHKQRMLQHSDDSDNMELAEAETKKEKIAEKKTVVKSDARSATNGGTGRVFSKRIIKN